MRLIIVPGTYSMSVLSNSILFKINIEYILDVFANEISKPQDQQHSEILRLCRSITCN